MILLFNYIKMLTQNILNTYCQLSKQHMINEHNYAHYNKGINFNAGHSPVNNKIYLSSTSIKNEEKKLAKYMQDFANKKLISSSLVAKLVNQYWEETIFLSPCSVMVDKYIAALQSSGISLHKSQHKKIMLEFAKALNTGRIEANIELSKGLSKKNSDYTYIKYIWRKGLNLPLPNNLLNRINPFFDTSNHGKKYFMKKFPDDQLPLFTVVNKFNQIIMAEPAREIFNNLGVIDKAYMWYHANFVIRPNIKPLYEGLFFVNPDDAFEYKNYIQAKYRNSYAENHIKVLSSRLSFYYTISDKYTSKCKLRIIPDLTELGKLLFDYKKLNSIFFHDNQSYGKTYFQGQPIYFIQPILAFNKKTKKKTMLKYDYCLTKKNKQVKYKAAFMGYKTALLAWGKFRQKYHNYKLPLNPSVMVYNLEDYINSNQDTSENILFIPSKESFDSVKSNRVYLSSSNVREIFSSKFLFLKVLTKRIIWSLTSRQSNVW
uniref:Uncharacterized protein n=1 Tax=Rhodymenia pseudopalmata TaxID=31502 RepID=A0A1C9C7K2_RHOPU|nr:hypothetical protein Rhodyp_072 [Rhodymenia pseudopalmata]AOM64350.1 hypothetical protein Rhodyp_072 [Rhodymenia pseudopalmata]